MIRYREVKYYDVYNLYVNIIVKKYVKNYIEVN